MDEMIAFGIKMLRLKVEDVLSKAFYGRLALPFLPTASILKAADLSFATDQVFLSKKR